MRILFFILKLPFALLSWLVDCSPYALKRTLGNLLAFIWFDFFRIRRKIILENINIAFPELSKSEQIELARKSMQNLGLNIVEYFSIPFLNKANWSKRFKLINEHHVDRAKEAGKGVFMMTLHSGNPDLAICGFSLSGRPFHVISKDFSVGWLNRFWFGLRSQHGTKFISARNSSYAILKALKANEFVLFTMDQFTGPPIGCKVKFFGKETGAAMGLAVLAQRSGADVIPVIPYRDKDGKQIIEHFPPIKFDASGTKDEAIERMTQIYTDQIEKLVRYKPEQWMWLHRRWKEFKH